MVPSNFGIALRPGYLQRVVLLWVVLLAVGSALAQTQRGAISGRVADPAGAVLHGARLTFQPDLGTVISDREGTFFVRDVPPGTYSVTVSFVGFSDSTSSITVAAGQTARLDSVLKVASKNEEVLVLAERPHGDAEAINRERTADNILQVLPQEVIESLPNANVADAVGRLPSVTLERDEGEGKYVQIRGTEPRLSNLTIDGINVPSPEAGVRQVKLDTIPSDVVESVEINKTLQANMDGDGIGGSVNVRTKTAGEQPTLTVNGLGGYTPILGGRGIDQFGATAGMRFGAQKRLGVLFGGTYDYNGRGIDDIEPVPTAGSAVPMYDSIDIREYQYFRTRWGFAGGLDYKLAEGSVVYAHLLWSQFKDYGDRWVYSLNTGGAPEFNNSTRVPNYSIGNFVIGGKHVYSTSWFAWEASAARSAQDGAAGNPGATFDPISPLADSTGCVYDPGLTKDAYRPQWSPNCFTGSAANGNAYLANQYTLTNLATTSGQTSQVNLLGSASWAKNYKIGGHFSTIEVGGKFRNAHKGQYAYDYIYTPFDSLPMSNFLNSFTNSNYYDGSYKLGPFASWESTLAYLKANPTQFASQVDHLGSDPANYDLTERVSAGYVMNTVDLGRFRLVAGVRIEGTQVDTRGYHVTNDADGNWLSTAPVTGTGSYVDVLPSAALKYRITDNSAIRLVYGRGLSRPNPYDLVPYIVEDESSNPFTFAIGNPNLVAEHANNYDLLYEQYLKPLGMIQAGVFYKDLTDPIVQINNPHVASGPYAGYQLSQTVNAGSGFVGGFELSYQQQLSFLPSAMSGIGISANYSWTTSTARGIPGRSDHPALLRQAPNTWNVSPGYDRGPLSIRVGLSYNGPNIYQYQWQDGADPTGIHGPSGDNYLYPHLQIDAQGSYRLPKGFQAVVYGLNINNEVFGFYNGSPIYVVQREFYKPTIAGGLRWTYSPEHK